MRIALNTGLHAAGIRIAIAVPVNVVGADPFSTWKFYAGLPYAVAMKATGLHVRLGRFGEVPPGPLVMRPANANEPADTFWPELSSQYALEHAMPPDARNAPKRVLLEVFLVVAIAVLASLAAIFWGPLVS